MISLNLQPAEKPAWNLSDWNPSDGCLEVESIWKTIQGEGPFAGTPAVFIRLSGCSLQCPSCDTSYTKNRVRMTVYEIRERVWECYRGSKISLVVITGGEPFRQSIGPLVEMLLDWEFKIQIETNGTLWTDHQSDYLFEFRGVSIIVSPKTPKIHPGFITASGERQRISALKYILSADAVDSVDGLPTRSLGLSWRPWRPERLADYHIYVQPADEGDEHRNKANLQAAIESCYRFGYTLSTQLHKTIGVE